LEVVLPQLLIHRSIDSLRGIVADVPPVPKIIEEHLPFLTQEEEEFYTGVQCVDDGYAMDIMTSIESFKLLLRLRQLSVHPQVYINAKRREDSTYDREDWTGPSTKFERIKEIIREDDKVHNYIIFCQFMEEMILLSKELSQYNVLQYNGSLTQKQRTEVLRKSKESTETTVLLIQLQAGGVGLNLQEYDRIIFVSPWWTSALMNQAIARAVRMGQKEVVRVYHLILSQEWENKQITNIDDRIQQKADEKQRMLEKIFQMCALIQFDQ
jgi:SNF2 family DNA or RNA helicase